MKNTVLWNVALFSLVKINQGVKKILPSAFTFHKKMSTPP